MIKVTFKDEGGIGPVQVIDTVAYAADPVVRDSGFGIPFGYKPQGVTELGWLNREEAARIAATHGVALEES